jgi:hypothetical protein
MSYWRTEAKFDTRCPLCYGGICIGDWIVQTEDRCAWAHAVCPRDVRKAPVEPEPSTYTEYRPKFDDEGNFIGMEEVTA